MCFQVIQAARRLYNPTGKKLPLPMIVELNRRLVKGYTLHKDEPRIIDLKKSVADYNKQLWLLGVRDHQVEYAKFSVVKVIFTLFYRLGKLAVMTVFTLPGVVLFAPVFIASKLISIKKSREALAASVVKLQGRDVIATWKLLVALAFAPTLYTFYTVLLTWWTHRNRVQGYVPEWVPLWAVVIFGYIFFPAITFAALRVGETGMDILKSLRPLILSLNPTSANTLHKLRERRAALSIEVTELINEYGPEMFPDFDSARIVSNPFRDGATSPTVRTPRISDASMPSSPSTATDASIGGGSSLHGNLPRNESFSNLGNIGLFATRPPSRSRSRSRTNSQSRLGGSSALTGLSNLDTKDGMDDLSRKIQGAMRERGQERFRRKSEDGSWDMASSGPVTPGSEEGKKEL